MICRRRVEKLLERGKFQFSGSLRGDALLICLGDTLLSFCQQQTLVEPWLESSLQKLYDSPIQNWNTFDLMPLQAVLCASRETIILNGNLVGEIGTLSHMARIGLFSHLSSPFIESNFKGHVTLELFNASPHIIRLIQGMPVAKIFLFKKCRSIFGNNKSWYGSDKEIGSLYYKEFGNIENTRRDPNGGTS